MTTAIATTEAPERLYTLGELESLGYGGRYTLLRRIHAGRLPAVKVGNAFKVRERHLDLIAEAVGSSTSAEMGPPVATDRSGASADIDTLAELAAKVVSAWPRLSDERKAELGRLLAMSS